MKKSTEGFTLIELLVVIAIIGILSAIVLASLNTARNRAKDATVQGQMNGMRAQSEIYYISNLYSYSGICTAAQTGSGFGGVGGPGLLYATAKNDALGDLSGASTNITFTTPGTWQTVTCHDSTTGWAAEAPLLGSVSGTPKMWCVDSTGVAKSVTTNLIASDLGC